MSVFWIVVALFVAGALLMLLPALLRPASDAATADVNVAVYRDHLAEAARDLAADLITPGRFAQARADVERRVLEDTVAAAPLPRPQAAWRTALVLALLLPLASVFTYRALGSPDAAAPFAAPAAAARAGESRHALDAGQIQKMVTALAERLRAEPANAEGWLMLGRSYTALGRYADAVTALSRASELLPGNAHVLADLADLMGMAQGRRLAGAPARVVQQALDADPRHAKALALAGSIALEARDYGAARSYWERLIAVAPVGSDIERLARNNIAEATQLERGGVPEAGVRKVANDAGAAALAGEVVLSPALAARVGPDDTLFVFARAAQGPRMPLAIVKRSAAELPLRFRLDDAMAMAPNLRLSGFAEVVVGARISRSGQALPQSGDLVGQSAVVSPGAQGLRIVIDSVQP